MCLWEAGVYQPVMDHKIAPAAAMPGRAIFEMLAASIGAPKLALLDKVRAIPNRWSKLKYTVPIHFDNGRLATYRR